MRRTCRNGSLFNIQATVCVMALVMLLSTVGFSEPTPLFQGVIRERIPVGGQPFKLIYIPDTPLLAAINSEGYVSFINRDEQETQHTQTFDSATFDAFLTPDHNWILVWSYYGDSIHFVSVEEQTYKESVKIGKNIGQLVALPETDSVFVSAVGSNEIVQLNWKQREVTNKIEVPFPIGHLTLTEDYSQIIATGGVYLSQQAAGSNLYISQLNSDTSDSNPIIRHLPSETHPRGVLTADNIPTMLIADRMQNRVVVINRKQKFADAYQVDLARGLETLIPIDGGNRWISLTRDEASIQLLAPTKDGKLRAMHTILISGQPWSLELSENEKWLLATLPGREIKTSRFFGGPPIVHGRSAAVEEFQDSVALIHLPTLKEVDVIQTNKGPIATAIHPTGREFAVACAIEGVVNIVY